MDDSHVPQNQSPAPGPRILILAPTGNDGPVTAKFLVSAGHQVHVCGDMEEVCREAESHNDVLLLAEETLNSVTVRLLSVMLDRQPPWSDIPIAIITSGGEASPGRLRILDSLGDRANVTLLERPFRRGTLSSTVAVALRARQRQQEMRNLLAERKNAEALLENLVQERTAELTETNEQLETLVYSIAHDLRAPLRSMQAFARILLEDYAPKLDEAAEKYAKRIVRSAETMDALVLDLLAYGKAARSKMEIEPINLADAWQSALTLFEQDISDLHAEIRTMPSLPWVMANGVMLSQILANLLGNALKFVPAGVAPVICFGAQECGGMVRISIEDNGIGIAKEYHEKIFRVFERLQKDKSEGTGIGLAIVRKGVERMGGKVGLDSGEPRVGTLFWIELPKATVNS
jgi:signal transduction histidine kinase